MQRRLTAEEARNVARGGPGKVREYAWHHRRVVGRANYVGKLHERVFKLEFASVHGFDPPNIEAGAKARVFAQMRVQSRLLDQCRTGHIFKDAILLKQPQLRLPDGVFSLRIEFCCNHKHIGLVQRDIKLIQRYAHSNVLGCFPRTVDSTNGHSESL